jgi:hypothetical protein
MPHLRDEPQPDPQQLTTDLGPSASHTAGNSDSGHECSDTSHRPEKSSTDFRLPDPTPEKTFRAAVAAFLKKPVNEVTDEQVVQILEEIRADANKAADDVIRDFDALYARLRALGLRDYEECVAYLRIERRAWCSLYALASKANPSPTEVRRLVTRICIDARHAVQGSLSRFIWQRTREGWLVGEFLSPPQTTLPLPPKCHQVTDLYEVSLLNAALAAPPRLYLIMEIIEAKFGGPPPRGETLEEVDAPRFCYAIEEGDNPRVRLWINEREVQLVGWRDVHNLLQELCREPKTSLSGQAAHNKLRGTNLYKAAGKIQESLKNTWPGAEQWLQRDPIRWAAGRFPSPRPPDPVKMSSP